MRIDPDFKEINKHDFSHFKASEGKTVLEQSIDDANKGKFTHIYNSARDFRKHLINESKKC